MGKWIFRLVNYSRPLQDIHLITIEAQLILGNETEYTTLFFAFIKVLYDEVKYEVISVLNYERFPDRLRDAHYYPSQDLCNDVEEFVRHIMNERMNERVNNEV